MLVKIQVCVFQRIPWTLTNSLNTWGFWWCILDQLCAGLWFGASQGEGGGSQGVGDSYREGAQRGGSHSARDPVFVYAELRSYLPPVLTPRSSCFKSLLLIFSSLLPQSQPLLLFFWRLCSFQSRLDRVSVATEALLPWTRTRVRSNNRLARSDLLPKCQIFYISKVVLVTLQKKRTENNRTAN